MPLSRGGRVADGHGLVTGLACPQVRAGIAGTRCDSTAGVRPRPGHTAARGGPARLGRTRATLPGPRRARGREERPGRDGLERGVRSGGAEPRRTGALPAPVRAPAARRRGGRRARRGRAQPAAQGLRPRAPQSVHAPAAARRRRGRARLRWRVAAGARAANGHVRAPGSATPHGASSTQLWIPLGVARRLPQGKRTPGKFGQADTGPARACMVCAQSVVGGSAFLSNSQGEVEAVSLGTPL